MFEKPFVWFKNNTCFHKEDTEYRLGLGSRGQVRTDMEQTRLWDNHVNEDSAFWTCETNKCFKMEFRKEMFPLSSFILAPYHASSLHAQYCSCVGCSAFQTLSPYPAEYISTWCCSIRESEAWISLEETIKYNMFLKLYLFS